MKKIYISGTARTPLGGFQGVFSSLSATDLGAQSIRATVSRAGIKSTDVEEVYFGNVVSAGLGQAPARQASLKAGLPLAAPCTTISKVCGSGMKAVMAAAATIRAEDSQVIVAGGMESMSNAPYLLQKARSGHRLGHQKTIDSLFVDGLEDAESGNLMGVFGQQTADKYNISREQMDDFALESLERAQKATAEGFFDSEIDPVTINERKGAIEVKSDEQLASAKPEKIRQLKPAFAKDGSVTAANSSSISDGAASMLIHSEEAIESLGLTPEAALVASASHAQLPSEFTIAPVGAVKKVLEKAGWSVEDVDLFEINEAFAVVAIHAMDSLNIPHEKVNIHGGACAIGHPLGASGARIIVTLIHALKRIGGKKGIASLCIGGGEATAVAIELV